MANHGHTLQGDGEHYIGIDVGTGSARACIINKVGDIQAVASKDIQTWQPQSGYYVSPHTIYDDVGSASQLP